MGITISRIYDYSLKGLLGSLLVLFILAMAAPALAAPTLSITPFSGNVIANPSPTFEGSAGDAAYTINLMAYTWDAKTTWYVCNPKDGAFNSANEEWDTRNRKYGNFSLGSHTLYVKARNTNGEWSSEASYTFTVVNVAVINSIDPISGQVDTLVTIEGSNFGATQGTNDKVTFAGSGIGRIEAPITSWIATQIVCKVPANAITGNIIVTAAGQDSNGVNFKVERSNPSVDYLDPASGCIGDTVNIHGANFGDAQGSSFVLFNGVDAGTAGTWTDTLITVTVPSGATTGDVTITRNPGGYVSDSVPFTVVTAPSITSAAPSSGPYGTSPWTTYVNINGSDFGSDPGAGNRSTASNHIDLNAVQVPDGNVVYWSATRIVAAVPSSLSSGTTYNVKATAGGHESNTTSFTAVTGQVIDNHENASMHNYYGSGAAGEAVIPTPTPVTSQYYEGQFAMRVQYPGATGSEWGGYWGGSLKTLTSLDLTACNMLVFRVKGDGSNNTIRLDVTEYKDGTNDEPYSSLDGSPLSDNSGFIEYKIPFTRLWRNEYAGSVKDDDVFSKKIKGYTFIYQGTNSTAAYNYVDFATAVAWNGPIIDLIGPSFGQVGAVATIEGSGFGATPESSTVTFNGISGTPTFWSATRIIVPVPAGATSGSVVVTVSSQASNGVPFTVTSDPGPAVSGLDPSSGPSGTPVTISGSNFGDDPGAGYRATASNHVVFGTAKVTESDVVSWSATQIVVNVPTLSDGVYPVQVRAGNKESNIVEFTVGGGEIAPSAPANLMVTKSGSNDVVLSWSATSDATGYNVYRGTAPNFTPGAGNKIGAVTTTTTTDAGALADANSYYYIVRAYNGAGESGNSNMGYLPKKTLTYASPGKHWISIAYKNSYANIQDIANDINGGTSPGTVTKISRWNPATQSYQSRTWNGSAWIGTNASVVTGESYEITINANTNLKLAGSHNPDFQFNLSYVSPAKNWISIPYSATYADIQAIANSINGGTSPGTVTKISRWNPATQAYQSRTWNGSAWIGTNASVVTGEGYEITINANTTWKPTVY